MVTKLNVWGAPAFDSWIFLCPSVISSYKAWKYVYFGWHFLKVSAWFGIHGCPLYWISPVSQRSPGGLLFSICTRSLSLSIERNHYKLKGHWHGHTNTGHRKSRPDNQHRWMDEKEGRNVLMRLMLQIMFICKGYGQAWPVIIWENSVNESKHREYREKHTNVYIPNHRLIPMDFILESLSLKNYT